MQFLRTGITFLITTMAVNCLAQARVHNEPLDVNRADSTTVNLYHERAFISQHFNRLPDKHGRLAIAGLPADCLNSSLSLTYGNNALLPKRITWPRTDSDRDGYFRALVGKQVEVLGHGRAVAGKLLHYHMGTGWVVDNNHRQYFVDLNDPRGLRMQPLEPVLQDKHLTAYFKEPPQSNALTLSYITSQLNFQSRYRLILSSEKRGQLTLIAMLVNRSNLDFTHADIRLITNDESGNRFGHMTEAVVRSDFGQKEQTKRVNEVLLTTLKTGLAANSNQLVDLLSANVAIEKQYTLDVYGRKNINMSPRLALTFIAPVDLPAAELSVYEQDGAGGTFISGNAWLTKTGRNEVAHLLLNEALTVRVERTRIGQRADQTQWQAVVFNDQQKHVTLFINEHDANVLKLENQQGVTLSEPNQIRIELAGGTRQTVNYTAIYQH